MKKLNKSKLGKILRDKGMLKSSNTKNLSYNKIIEMFLNK